MKIEYSLKYSNDLENILERSTQYGARVTRELTNYIYLEIERIASFPESAKTLSNREGVRVLFLVRFPFAIFYKVFPDRIYIQHIQHTARLPWREVK